MAQHGGMILPPPSKMVAPHQAERQGNSAKHLETSRNISGSIDEVPNGSSGGNAAQKTEQPSVPHSQLSWVPKLYYWMRSQYSILSSSGLKREPIWLLGVCYHRRTDALACQQDAAAAAHGGDISGRRFGAALSARLGLGDMSFPATRAALGVSVGSSSAARKQPRTAGPAVISAPDENALWFFENAPHPDDTSDTNTAKECEVQYSLAATARLETAYASGQRTIDLSRSVYVDFDLMVEAPFDKGDKHLRPVRRVSNGDGNSSDGRRLMVPETNSCSNQQNKSHSGSIESRLGWSDFVEHFASLIWFSYRENFAYMGPPITTTDAGWGCMLRTAQMLLAQALIATSFGKGWQLPTQEFYAGGRLELEYQNYLRVVRLFGDWPDCPLSIHNMVRSGGRLGKAVGEWYGPATAARVLQELVSLPASGLTSRLRVWISSDNQTGTIYTEEVEATGRAIAAGAAQPTPASLAGWQAPVLLLFPLQLGFGRHINAAYIPLLLAVSRLPQFTGFIGGSPSSSFYFVASQGEEVLYLDPHTVQPTIDNRLGDFSTESYHCRAMRSMRLENIDPSLTLAFLVTSHVDFANLCSILPDTTNGMICNIAERASAMDEVLLDRLAMGEDSDDSGDDW